MGAEDFYHFAKGKTAKEAFQTARKEAQYDYGHRGYTGTIAEKDDFVVVKLPAEIKPDRESVQVYAHDLVRKADPRIDSKWGPAGCISFGKDEHLFFGWASS